MTRLLYIAAILCSALLLFLVQPLFARQLLPLLGGSPSVWNTALVFYQGTLLAGYAYAHYSIRWLGAKRQAMLHAGLLLLPLLFLPIGLKGEVSPPATGSPVLWLLGTMALTIGVPFFVISASSPLLQRWFGELQEKGSKDPYFLYAASNVGSFLGLFAYPLFLEPRLTLQQQSLFWSIGYGAVALLLAGAAFVLIRSMRTSDETSPDDEKEPAGAMPDVWRKFRWVMLAFVPSALLMGVTTYITTDVASMPLLWALPLAIYLITFSLAFGKWPGWLHALFVFVLPFLIVLALIVLIAPLRKPIPMVMGIGVGTFFVASMVCHRLLALDRPPTKALTEFYLLISVGGVLGGAFCALLAPAIFVNVLEYPIALVICLALLPAMVSERGRLSWLWDLLVPAAAGGLTFLAFEFMAGRVPEGLRPLRASVTDPLTWAQMNALAMAIGALLCIAAIPWPRRLALGMTAVMIVSMVAVGQREGVIYEDRGFFGTLRVVQMRDAEQTRVFYHGTTIHGQQNMKPELQSIPTSYYFDSSPIGEILILRGLPPEARVASVGLGVGSLTMYARPGEDWNLYEIDPLVEEVARDPNLFTYLSIAEAPFEVILGDARLRLAQTDRQYDLIILDAYSSDSVPVHLLTREALAIYLQRLRPGGVIMFHISNRYLDLEPVVAGIADDAGLIARTRDDFAVSDEERKLGKNPSVWMAVVRELDDLGVLADDPNWKEPVRRPEVPIWTDDYSSVPAVLRVLDEPQYAWMRVVLGLPPRSASQ